MPKLAEKAKSPSLRLYHCAFGNSLELYRLGKHETITRFGLAQMDGGLMRTQDDIELSCCRLSEPFVATSDHLSQSYRCQP